MRKIRVVGPVTLEATLFSPSAMYTLKKDVELPPGRVEALVAEGRIEWDNWVTGEATAYVVLEGERGGQRVRIGEYTIPIDWGTPDKLGRGGRDFAKRVNVGINTTDYGRVVVAGWVPPRIAKTRVLVTSASGWVKLRLDGIYALVEVEEPRAVIERIEAPDQVYPGEAIPVTVTVANTGARGYVFVEANGERQEMVLGKGERKKVSFSLTAGSVGERRITVKAGHVTVLPVGMRKEKPPYEEPWMPKPVR